ncbi:unnamed protein product [Clonostachys byssicola]|uniref:Desumoylating isopeptidase 1 n=1 Tax=Clonostachys byssicola TaxID=160290 RepID=A0A9N9YCN8_9HYPO|nr:unnamed protein product [Clonostachys byssicola]
MDVQLLVYDLSRGLARQMSQGLLGFQLDAIYHTSIELQGREYVYDGGIIAITPGTSHLGQPMERLHLGKTNLTMDIVEDYLESIRPIFTLEAYDLFHHNCNNFTDSFSNFLLGKGIPSHISSMPQAVLDSPMGRMLLPQLTQGINGSRQNGSILGLEQSAQPATSRSGTLGASTSTRGVKNITSVIELARLLDEAKDSCAAIFFTSATCPPCKTVYPLYDQLAEEFHGKMTLIKIDISLPGAEEAASQYSISATPTFITFLKGQQVEKWSGADYGSLNGNLRLLVEMAFPSHPHMNLRLPSFNSTNRKPVLYSKVPPMEKLLAKLGNELAQTSEVKALRHYIETREKQGEVDAILPDLAQFGSFIQKSLRDVPLEKLFIIVDLFRCTLVDTRVSGYFAEENSRATISQVLELVNSRDDSPYPLRLVTLQMVCNMFSTPLFPREILKGGTVLSQITTLVSSNMLDGSHPNLRVAASSLLFNLALEHRKARDNKSNSLLPESDQIELGASVVEAISQENGSVEALQGMLSALGHLFYGADLEGELAGLLRALDAESAVLGKKTTFPNEKLVSEVGAELLGKGLRKP